MTPQAVLGVLAVVWWVLSSPTRTATIGAAWMLTHPAPAPASLIITAAVILTTIATVIFVGSLSATGGRLMHTYTRPVTDPEGDH
jgi:hypothetical protein